MTVEFCNLSLWDRVIIYTTEVLALIILSKWAICSKYFQLLISTIWSTKYEHGTNTLAKTVLQFYAHGWCSCCCSCCLVDSVELYWDFITVPIESFTSCSIWLPQMFRNPIFVQSRPVWCAVCVHSNVFLTKLCSVEHLYYCISHLKFVFRDDMNVLGECWASESAIGKHVSVPQFIIWVAWAIAGVDIHERYL